jgi:hypothetical protein
MMTEDDEGQGKREEEISAACAALGVQVFEPAHPPVRVPARINGRACLVGIQLRPRVQVHIIIAKLPSYWNC